MVLARDIAIEVGGCWLFGYALEGVVLLEDGSGNGGKGDERLGNPRSSHF